MTNLLNLKEIDQEEAFNLVKFFINVQQNVFLFGRRGVGKTNIIMQAAEECGLKLISINLSVIERPDLAGYPNINDSADTVSFKLPNFLPALIEGTAPDTILLFDEVDKAPPEITGPLLEILQFKRINGKKLNVNNCILTGNLMSEGAHSNLISSALLDRGSKYILSFNFEKWLDWARSNNVHDLITGFLKNHPELSCGKNDDYSYASPSPRTWTLASDALFNAKNLKIIDIDTIFQIVSGFVGEDAGLKFKIWYQYYRQYEPHIISLINNNKLNINFNDLLPTEKIIFVISACHFAKQSFISANNSSKKNKMIYLENLCNFFIQNKVDTEIQIMGLHNSFDFNLIQKYKLYTSTIFFNHFTTLSQNVSFKK